MKLLLPATTNETIIQAAYHDQYDFLADFSNDYYSKPCLVNAKDPQNGDTLLHIAINKIACNPKDDRLLNLVHNLTELFTVENKNEMRPLELAASLGLWDFILNTAKRLENSKDFKSFGLDNTLVLAAELKKTVIVYRLLTVGVNPNHEVNNQSALSKFAKQRDWLSARIFQNPKAVQKEHWRVQTQLACLLYAHFTADGNMKNLPYEILKMIFDFMYSNISPDFYDFNIAKEKYASVEWTKKLEQLKSKRISLFEPIPAPKPTETTVWTVSNDPAPPQNLPTSSTKKKFWK